MLLMQTKNSLPQIHSRHFNNNNNNKQIYIAPQGRNFINDVAGYSIVAGLLN